MTQQAQNSIDFKSISSSLINTDLDEDKVQDSIIEFSNKNMTVIDGSLSKACSQALNKLLPKNTTFIPRFTMESSVMHVGKYKPLKQYAQEQYENKKQILGLLYFMPITDKNIMQDYLKLNESLSNMGDEQKKYFVVYVNRQESTDTVAEDAKQWCQSNGIKYSEELSEALDICSGGITYSESENQNSAD